MKPLAIAVFSFLAGLFTPAITTQKISLSLPNVNGIDPVVIIMGLMVVWAIGKARAKRKGGRA